MARDVHSREQNEIMRQLGLLALVVMLAVVVMMIPLGGALAGLWHGGRWAWPSGAFITTMRDIVLHPDRPAQAYPSDIRSALPGPVGYWASVAALEALLLFTAVFVIVAIAARRANYGMLTRAQLKKAMKKAQSPMAPIGRYLGVPLRPRPNDAMLIIAPQQSGKTTGLAAPGVKDAPGAVVASSTKVDLMGLTIFTRHDPDDTGDDREVHVFDVDRVSGWPRLCRWNMVEGCEEADVAQDRARAAIAASPEAKGEGGNSAFFRGQAAIVLSGLLHAAAISGGTMRQVRDWAFDFGNDEPREILANNPRALPGWEERLRRATQGDATQTTASTSMTLAGALECLSNPEVLEMVCPPTPGSGIYSQGLDDECFDIARFVARNKDTLYLVTLGGEGVSTAPLVTAFVSAVVREGRLFSQRQPGGKITPPETFILDEAANAAPIPSMPTLLSDGGGRGQTTRVFVQAFSQGRDKWGREGFSSMWGATSLKMLLPGCTETEDLEHISRLIGDRKIRQDSISSSGLFGSGQVSTNNQPGMERIMPVDTIQQLDDFTGLCIYKNVGNAVIDVTPWWKRPDAKDFKNSLTQFEVMCGSRAELPPATSPARGRSPKARA